VAEPQDAARATKAAKLSMEEGLLDFREPAQALHNKARRPPPPGSARAAPATRPGAGLPDGACPAASAGHPRVKSSRSVNPRPGAMPCAMPRFAVREII